MMEQIDWASMTTVCAIAVAAMLVTGWTRHIIRRIGPQAIMNSLHQVTYALSLFAFILACIILGWMLYAGIAPQGMEYATGGILIVVLLTRSMR